MKVARLRKSPQPRLTSPFGVGGGVAQPALDDLSDVDLSGLSDGNTIVFDSGSGLWVPGTGSGSANLPWSYAQADGGLAGDGVTDDTAAFQAWIATVTANGTRSGWFWFEPGTYIIGGSLQDTSAFNGQILLPDVADTDSEISLTFQGPARPPFQANGPLPDPAGYAILQSTLTGASGTASAISGGNQVFSDRNNITVTIKDLLCLVPNDPTLSFWNLSAVQGAHVENVMLTTLEWTSSGTTATHSNAYAVKLPQQGQSNYTYVDGLVVSEFYVGVQMGELTNLKGYVAFRCIVAVELTSFPHASVIWSMEQTACVYGIKVINGTWNSRCDVYMYAAEHWASPATTYDLDDSTNSMYGDIRWHAVDNVTGADVSFLQNGGTNTTNHRIGPISASGGVATDPIWDAAGDLAVGTGADTAARLAKGGAGANLAVINSVVTWDSGTSNPGSAVTGDRFYRRDLGLEIMYNGSIWVTMEIFRSGGSKTTLVPATAAGTSHYITLNHSTFDAVIGTFYSSTFVLTTNNGSNYWTVTLSKTTAGNTPTALGNFNTSGDTASNWVSRATSIAATVATGTYKVLQIDLAKTAGAPGNLYFDLEVDWRLAIP